MIKANFNAYASYVADSVYQWDVNQVLTVSGLNLSVAPEVHFANSNMDRAIVRQATMTNHVVSVRIPNSLLQQASTIRAYIGIYEGNTFKVVEEIEIPVIARKQPNDYQIEDADEEVYSFKALENALSNKADNARVDNIIAHNNDTNGNTELIDLRVDFEGNTHTSVGAAIRRQFGRAIKSKAYTRVTADNYTKSLPDLNEANDNTIYGFLFASNLSADKMPANLPFEVSYGVIWVLLTIEGNNVGTYRTQIFINAGSGEIWTRYYSTVWTEWVNRADALSDKFNTYLESKSIPITSDNYKTTLPDANDAPRNSVYRLLFASGLTSGSFPANLPLKKSSGTMWSLITLGGTDVPTYSTQIFVNHGSGDIWTRLRGSEWGAWSKNGNSVYYVGASENLLEVLIDHQGDTIYVPAGDYDIIQIYKDYAGEDYFDTYEGYASGNDNIGKGLPLYDGTRLICSPNAKFTCHYTGDNANVTAYFSAFATGNGFTLDGLHLETSGVRYAVHDDFNNSFKPYKTTIKNCRIRDARRAIGGGMGTQGIYEILNNYFGNDAGGNDVAYHNNAVSGRNRFTVSGNYFENNLSFRHYGESISPTECLVSNNSFGGAIEIRFENEDYNNENVRVLEWNNTVR